MIDAQTHDRMTERPTAESASTGNVLVSGSSGLVGRALLDRLASRGRRTMRLVRTPAVRGEVRWDPLAERFDASSIAADAVVHLAGENIADARWSRRKMEAIRASRVLGTQLLCESLTQLEKPPEVLVSASAIGYYGDGGDRILTEGTPRGSGFLAEVCNAWERATEPARDAGIRVVRLRIGVVLSRDGGALQKMLFPFKLGLGGRLGHGDQYMSWIHLDDLVSIICKAIDDKRLAGPLNATAPEPVTNRAFTRELGRVLRRPTLAAVPAFAARAAFGRMADALLLASLRVRPERLLETGFRFEHPVLAGALRAVLADSR